jgi:epoxyqueuosine reductase
LRTETIQRIARECGFELAGVAPAGPVEDFARYQAWVARGYAGEMRYLIDHRREVRRDVRNLLPSARSVICVGKLYNTGPPRSAPGDARISRYAWGRDYHGVLRRGLERLVERLLEIEPFEWKICVDTAPLLERSLARAAGLGWIGKNTCLINEPAGSWFFLGAIVTSLEAEPGLPPEDRCGTCARCIEACPTGALVPDGGGGWTLDSRRCISYLTIELRGPIPEELRAGVGQHLFGCDICQEVCPWNARAPLTQEPAFREQPVRLDELEGMSEAGFRERFRDSAVARAKYAGLLRNAAVVRGNTG